MADPYTDVAAPQADRAATTRAEPPADEQALVGLVTGYYDRGLQDRRLHEPQWFINGAFLRGQQYVVWANNTLVTPPAARYRIRLTINRIQPKARARLAKFLKKMPKPQALPATAEFKDRQDARLTSRALLYQYRVQQLQRKYRDALIWAAITGHGYWWLGWDDKKLARVQLVDPLTRQKQVVDVPLGDLTIEVAGPAELVVCDQSLHDIALQPWIIRVRMRDLDDLRQRYGAKADRVAAESREPESFGHERRLSTLNSQGLGGAPLPEDYSSERGRTEGRPRRAKVLEYFERPCPTYPKGRYLVVAGGVLLRSQNELPYQFWDLHNPYPVVDFVDFPQVGQYWITTVIEQLIGPQREYNLLRSKLAEHVRLAAWPKVLAAQQHKIKKGAWTSEPGEIIEYLHIPNVPAPQVVQMPNVAPDVWQSFQLLQAEMEDISHIFPESEGRIAGTESGFQTQLLQEATEAVHQPDLQAHSMALQDAYFKIRRMMRLFYDVPRLLTVVGQDLQPEAFEFSADDINEHADILVEIGEALPSNISAKSEIVLNYLKAGVFGDIMQPEVQRRVASMLELGTVEDIYDYARRDEEQARGENDKLMEGQPPAPPEFYENHETHFRVHTDLLKSPATLRWPPEQRVALISHVLGHMSFINPQGAFELSQLYGVPLEALNPAVAALQQQQMAPTPDAGMAGAPPPPPGMPESPGPAAGGPAGPPSPLAPPPPPIPGGGEAGGVGPVM